MKRIRILIVDDHAIVRTGLRSLLDTQPDMEVVSEADDGISARDEACRHKPDVVVMDLMMPKMDGAAATQEILSVRPQTRILLITSAGAADGITRALHNGAAGALLKSEDNNALINAIRHVACGETVVSQELHELLCDSTPRNALTDRQMSILELIVRGFSNRDIADCLKIRVDSIKKHANQIYEKIGAANRAEAVGIALKKHLLKI